MRKMRTRGLGTPAGSGSLKSLVYMARMQLSRVFFLGFKI